MAKSVTNGNCYLCGTEAGKTAMKNHILKEHCSEGDETCYLLIIEGAHAPDYWLIVDVALGASLSSIDSFLRKIWLECCGHLSEFNSGRFGDTIGKSRKVGGFSDGDKIVHSYDFGTTTETRIMFVAKSVRPKQKSVVRLLARNIPPLISCKKCGKRAEFICHECGGVYDGAFFCGQCAEKHKHSFMLPVTNSPRSGECGYDGELDDFEFSPTGLIPSEKKNKLSEKKNEPSVEQWSKLYKIAADLKILAPWEKLWDADLTTIVLPNRREPIYISVMGRNGQCYGIGVYPGYRSLAGLYRLMDENDGDNLALNPLGYMNCLMCNYGNREELIPEDRELLKALDIKFRGENNWIHFRSQEAGYFPWFLNAAQVELMTVVLQEFSIAYQAFSSGEVKEITPHEKEYSSANSALPLL